MQIAWDVGGGSDVTDVYFDDLTFTILKLTSINYVSSDNTGLEVVVVGKVVTVKNVRCFEVYNAQGKEVKKVRGDGSENIITIAKSGIYIVKSGGLVKKILVE